MAAGTYFVRACPTCGRSLEIRVELLSREVECSHCRAKFLAGEVENRGSAEWRVEQALARTQAFLASPGNNPAAREVG